MRPTATSPHLAGAAGRLALRLFAVIAAGLGAVAAFIGAGLAMLGLCCGAPLAVAGAGTAATTAGASVNGPASWPFFLGAAAFFAAAWMLHRGAWARACRPPARRSDRARQHVPEG